MNFAEILGREDFEAGLQIHFQFENVSHIDQVSIIYKGLIWKTHGFVNRLILGKYLVFCIFV